MIEALSGILREKSNLKAVIDVNGIEFNLTIPLSTFDKLPNTNKRCRLFVELVIGEKSIKLYGFATKEEKNLFNELRKISKIGPQTAISILSNISVEEFYAAIQKQDKELLTQIPGIGKKTALNIIVELSNKIPNDELNIPSVVSDAIETLISLGFSKQESEKTVKEIYSKDNSVKLEDLIKESLKSIGKHGR
ncbi:Holliday junction branch migration protein RuvA [Hippea alviniae]|uniref:Holliday junction branch migration protein RuvA n=1 Tax=Hippea alviniae TaxID=1279027 RepID=UPI0003B63409|nr:Holliday junction branch migration protein RuvA [Hippea alviniae]